MPVTIQSDKSALVIIDVQERLCPAMDDPRRVLHNGARLIKGAQRLNVPVLATEQYPQGIGPTMVDLRSLLPDDAVIQKMTFSAAREPALIARLRSLDVTQVVMMGTEAHVCVQQSALELAEQGWDVFVVADACSSRKVSDQDAAYARMAANGCSMVTTEMVLFEWLGEAGTPAFKDVLPLIKQ
ncbi:MAG: hydrolase [Rhodospirillaceae bacterium]